MLNEVDIKENDILKYDTLLLETLLIDRNKPQGKGSFGHIIWGTDAYINRGKGYRVQDEITVGAISGKHGSVIKPRVVKSKTEQAYRIKDKAEVFTPSWICNKQNNLIDDAWFGIKDVFNTEIDKGWQTNKSNISFPTKDGKTWIDYIKDTRLEVSCGEAPYLVSRYDAITGKPIPVNERIGLLDRKLRVVSENVHSEQEWIEYAILAVKSIYGYEWQGDNLLLARENVLFTFVDFYNDFFGKIPQIEILREVAEVISWNLWQMDGLRGVIPYSCKNIVTEEYDLFEGCTKTVIKCEGCEKGDLNRHNGVYCKIKDWETGGIVRFVSMIK